MAASPPACFKAYDIRGKVPDELHPELAVAIGRSFAAVHGLRKVAVGRDIRLSSPVLAAALSDGLRDMGATVLDLGLCGTEEIYHAAFSMAGEGVDGGVIVTASHNPADYNGMKFVLAGARPVTGEGGLAAMAEMITTCSLPPLAAQRGTIAARDNRAAYIAHLLGTIDGKGLAPLKIVTNAGNGCAGPIIDRLAEHLPLQFITLNHQPDGTFPKGVPNPLLPDKRAETAAAVVHHRADMAIAWDGDFDRCFFWDERGEFIEGYYLVGLLARAMLLHNPGAKILYDPRLVWSTEEDIRQAGGIPVLSRTGHAFIKERMRAEDALYGGEMSAHHYFRDFGYCDSGMIPWLLVAELLSRSGRPLSEMVAARQLAYPVSGEINRRVADPDAVITRIEKTFVGGAYDYTDGLSVAFADYRFNVRKSNTEPLLRLNVETRGDAALLQAKTAELLALIG
jgi:phosphomannomutase